MAWNSSQQGGAPLNNPSQLPLLRPQSHRNPTYSHRAASLSSRNNKELYGAPVYVTGEDHRRRLANTTPHGAQYPAPSGFNALRHSQTPAAQTDAALSHDPSFPYGTVFDNASAPEPAAGGRQLDVEPPQHAPTYVGQFPVPAQGPSTGNGTFPDQGSSSHLPSAANAPDSRPSSEFTGGNKRKLSIPSSQLPFSYKDLPRDHPWYLMFNYKEYMPQKNKKGKTGGTRSIDHVRGTEIKDRYATWSFQHDPIKFWLLRDVAEKFPTKVREKESKHYQQYGSETESQPVILDGDEEEEEEDEEEGQSLEGVFDADGEVSVPASTGKRTKRRRISDESSVKLEESSVYDGESEKSSSPKKKGRTNWDRSYQRRFPGEAIPSSTPLFRETVHTLIHAGKPDNAYGPRDINTCFIKALERCSDPNFHRYLLEKLKDLNGSSSPSTEYRPPSSLGRPASVRSRKAKSITSHYMEDIQESMETQMPRTYQRSNHSSHQTHGGIHQETSPSPDQTHHQIASGFPTGLGGGSDLFNSSEVPFSDMFISQNGEIDMHLFPLYGVNEPQYPSSITDPLDEGEDNI